MKGVKAALLILWSLLLTKVVLADIITPSIGLIYLPLWSIIVFNFLGNSVVILLGLKLLKETAIDFKKFSILIIILTILGFVTDFLIEMLTFREVPASIATSFAVSVVIFTGYTSLLSRKILKISLKKALILGLMIAILINPIVYSPLFPERRPKQRGVNVDENIRYQIIDDLRVGDKKLSFPISEIRIEEGEPKIIPFGVKNTGEEILAFDIKVKLFDSEGNEIDHDVLEGFSIGYDSSRQLLDAKNANVYPIQITIEKKGDYIAKLELIDTKNNDDETDDEIYAEQNFSIKVT